MPLTARFIIGCLAVFLAWTMIRAAKSGTVFDDGRAYVEGERPGMFVLVMIGHFVCILFCLWLAAGYSAESFLAQLGLGALVHKP
jgi:hypothetical protein